MLQEGEVIYIFWTCKDAAEAKEIIGKLLDCRVIACASLFPQVESIYHWEGKVETSCESKVILKTTKRQFQAVEKTIRAHCSYDVPEIVEVPISRGNPEYFSWVVQETF